MGRIDKTVFLSYRRTNVGYALAIYQNLTQKGYDVFFDYNSIDSGDFEQIILNNIASRAHFLVLLTPSALERVHEEGDWLRREIEYAIESKRNIVPLTMEGFDWKYAQAKLTANLAPLGNYNALRVPADYFSEAMDRLALRFLNVEIDAVIHPRNSEAQKAASRAKTQANVQPKVQEKELTAQEWFEKGVAKHKQSNYEGAIEDYTRAILLDERFAEAYFKRGHSYWGKDNKEKALADYEKAAAINPQHPKINIMRAYLWLQKGKLGQALKEAEKGIIAHPELDEAYLVRALVRSELKYYEDTVSDFTQVIELNPDSALAYYNRGVVYWMQGDFHKCVTDWEMCLKINPNNKDAKEWLPKAKAILGGKL